MAILLLISLGYYYTHFLFDHKFYLPLTSSCKNAHLHKLFILSKGQNHIQHWGKQTYRRFQRMCRKLPHSGNIQVRCSSCNPPIPGEYRKVYRSSEYLGYQSSFRLCGSIFQPVAFWKARPQLLQVKGCPFWYSVTTTSVVLGEPSSGTLNNISPQFGQKIGIKSKVAFMVSRLAFSV